MSENNKDNNEKEGGIKISVSWFGNLFGLKTWQFLYAFGSVVGMGYGAYKLFYKEDEPKQQISNPQIVINIPKDTTQVQQASVPVPVVAPIEQAASTEKETEKIIIREVIKETVQEPVRSVREEKVPVVEEPEEEDDFGFAKNKNKSSSSSSTTYKTTFVSCYVLGNYEIKSGSSIKIRLTEDLILGKNIIPKNTQVVGEIENDGNRINITVKENKDLPVALYAIDKDKNLGIPVQQKLLDGYRFSLTNTK